MGPGIATRGDLVEVFMARGSFQVLTYLMTLSLLHTPVSSFGNGPECSSVFAESLPKSTEARSKEAIATSATAPLSVQHNFKQKVNAYSIARSSEDGSAVDILIDPNSRLFSQYADKLKATSEKTTPLSIAEVLLSEGNETKNESWLTSITKKMRPMGKGKKVILDLPEARALPAYRSLYSALAAKTLLDNLTSVKSSALVHLKSVDSGRSTSYEAVAIKNERTNTLQIMIPFVSNKLFEVNGNGQIIVDHPGGTSALEVTKSSWTLEPLDAIKTPKTTDFKLMTSTGKILSLSLIGRSAFERKVKQEAELIEQAHLQDEVPLEWYFHPHYAPLGHTTVRIGGVLYNFTTRGWDIHGEGASNPRAFLFNNPFFKSQYENFKDKGMPPFTLGVTVMVKKQDAVDFIRKVQSGEQKSFNLFFNNCNQCVIRNLPNTPLATLDSSFYQGFSSVLSFRQLLIEDVVKTQGTVSLYPVTTIDPSLNLRELVPARVYKDNSALKEIFYNLKNWKAPRSTDKVKPSQKKNAADTLPQDAA